MHFTALIPAYEPEENMIPLLAETRKLGMEIVLVNDGSGPAYSDIFDRANSYATILSYEENHGKGYALRTGLKYILENWPADTAVVTMDCDGQHKPEDALKLLQSVEQEPETVFFGSREIPKDAPLKSRFGNAVTRVWYTLITHKKLHDTQTGLRAFSLRYIELLLSEDGDRYEYEIGTVLALSKHKVEIREMPIETIYINNNAGTHFNAVPDTLKIWKRMLRYSKLLLAGIISAFAVVVMGITLLTMLFTKKKK